MLCVDEKTQVQALDRTAPVLPLRPGLPERATHDYVRNGTTNHYGALDMASGKVIADMTDRHRAVELRKFLNLINRSVPDDLDVHLIAELRLRTLGQGRRRSLRPTGHSDLQAGVRRCASKKEMILWRASSADGSW